MERFKSGDQKEFGLENKTTTTNPGWCLSRKKNHENNSLPSHGFDG
jgi:hypothetical protein